jgi:hypothetical protein
MALLCTDLGAKPAEVLGWFVRRWSVEVTFAEARRHPGLETRRRWPDAAAAAARHAGAARPVLARRAAGGRP